MYFQPSLASSSQLLSEVVTAIDKTDQYEITVLCAHDNYSDIHNINVISLSQNVKVKQFENIIFRRMARNDLLCHMLFYFLCFTYMLFRKFDLVVCMTAPPLNPVVAYMHSLFKFTPFIAVCRIYFRIVLCLPRVELK